MPPLSLMIKPVSGQCNMRCTYCFYRDVAAHREQTSYGRMTEETLETLVRRAFAYAEGSVSFAFQGGEPTLAGLDFYRQLVALQKKYNSRGLRVSNALQTNGLLIDEDFAAFLGEHHFLVGLSMDGDKATHDLLRPNAVDAGTFDRVKAAAKRLQAHQVEFNILCVITAQVAARPEAVFDALAPYRYLQFIPCLEGFEAEASPYTLTAQAYGDFLCRTFDRYEQAWRAGHPVSVRTFDNYLQVVAGYPAEHCGMNGVCSKYYLVEADGGVYPCDFYVLDPWRLGNVCEASFARLAKAEAGEAFVQSSRQVDPACRGCKWYALCKGGCRREREPQVEGRLSLNRFCESYQQFFEHAYERMRAMSEVLLAREP